MQGDAFDGIECSTSAECGPLRCIDEHCRDVNAVLRHEPVNVRFTTAGSRMLFGDGHEYVMAVLLGDILASVTVPAFIALASSGNSAGFGVAALFPPTLTGPIIHFANGRPAAGVISFFGWASVAPTAVGLGVLAAAAAGFGNGAAFGGIVTFTLVALGGASAMTAVDVYLARKVSGLVDARVDGLRVIPSVTPIRGGALAGMSGVF